MSSIKRGINIHLPVKFTGVEMDDVRQIDFIFKKTGCECDTAQKQSVYKADGSGDAQRLATANDIILVPFTEAETRKFCANESFYMDTLIKMTNSTDNPLSNIVKINVNPTLFKAGDVDG